MKRLRKPILLAASLFASSCLYQREAPTIVSDASVREHPIDMSTQFDAEPPAELPGNHLMFPPDSTLAHVFMRVNDGATGLPISSRVIVRNPPKAGFADSLTDGTFDPQSPGGGTGAIIGPGVVGSPEGVLLHSGVGDIPLPAGQYTFFVTRGPEYEAEEVALQVVAGQHLRVEVTLDHSVDTGGWISTDLHVHSNRSFDSKLPVERRVISLVSNGVQLLVGTDHNVSTDLSDAINMLGYGPNLVGSVVGNEFNFGEGHAGAYPVPYDPTDQKGGGAPPWLSNCSSHDPSVTGPPLLGINCLTAHDAFAYMHNQLPGQTVVTVNHPYWPGADLGYFTNIGWGVGTPRAPNTPLETAGDFDALEVLNGYWVKAEAIDAILSDWFALTDAGYKVAALGNSDSHRINWVRAGFPRTWLRLPVDNPGEVTGAMLADAIRNQRAIASTGPFVNVTVDGAQIGDTVVPHTAGQVTVKLTVDAPRWIVVDTVQVYINGVVKKAFHVTPGTRPVFQTSFTQTLSKDSYFVVVASGQTPLPPDVVGESSKANGWDFLPWAITNPIYVDVGGDGYQAQVQWSMPQKQPARQMPSPVRVRKLSVPQDCDPANLENEERVQEVDKGFITEPPLDGPGMSVRELEHYLMPHLYQR